MFQQEWFTIHWDNMPVHFTSIVKNCLASRVIQVLPHPAYLPDLALVDFFLFRKVNLSQESLKKEECLGRGRKDHCRRGLRHRFQLVV
jgi:hypothetical protein